MSGLYGGPLEAVKGWLQGLDAFADVSPSVTVYLYERTGGGAEPEAGDGWAVLSYAKNGHALTVKPTFDIARQIELTLVRCVRAFTEGAKESLVTDVGAVVSELLADDEASLAISKVTLDGFALDDTADPPRLGAVLRLTLDIGMGR